jgi:hypothetical protein
MVVKLPPQPDDPSADLTPQLIVEVIRDVAFHYFLPCPGLIGRQWRMA